MISVLRVLYYTVLAFAGGKIAQHIADTESLWVYLLGAVFTASLGFLGVIIGLYSDDIASRVTK